MKKIRIEKDLIKIIISIVIFIISLFVEKISALYIGLILLSYIIISYELFVNAIKNIMKGEIFDENFLMIIATIGAFVIKEYPEGVIVVLLFQIGEYLSDLAVDNSKKEIMNLMDLRSDYANIIKNGQSEKVEAKNLKIGDVFIVKPGEKVPLDGVIINGESMIDTSMITGESVPRGIKKGDIVISGFLNKDSIIEVEAKSTYETSTASKIIELMEKSSERKSNSEKFITKFAKIYTPIVVILAVLIVLIPWIMGLDINEWIYRALVFLVISCPCALVISIPLGFFCGIGKASKEGVLVKGSNELDRLSKMDIVVFDKTGTITKGVFKITEIKSNKITEDELLRLAAHAEYYSNHPIAKSIINEYKAKIDESKIKEFKEISGKGIEVLVDDKKIIIGNEKLMKLNNIQVENVESIGTLTYIASSEEYLGYIVISDIIKDESYDIVEKLKKEGVKQVAIVSGDNENIVKNVSKKVNINKYYSNAMPDEKVNIVNELKKQGFTTFVGDGVNDAAVMKTADIGIAMGKIGSDIAIETADVLLMKDNLDGIIKAINISKKTKNIVKFNISFSITAKVIVLILGALGISSIWMAVFADVGVTIIAILNSLRIMKNYS